MNLRPNCDSYGFVTELSATIVLTRDRATRRLALCVLALIALVGVAGPSGVLAWGENLSQLDQRKARIAALVEERDELRNRVNLLNPAHVDPDLAGELVRDKLNLTHPDDVIVMIKPDQ